MAVRRIRQRGGEEGFSLLESVIALGILFVALTLLAHGLLGSFRSIAFARQRQVATAMANQVLEQVRALPFDQLDMGNTDLAASVSAGEADLTVTGSGPSAVYRFRGREIPRAEVVDRAPVVPHTVTSVPGPGTTSYTRSLYITRDPATPSVRLVTARVAWTPSGRASGGVVEMETLVTGYQCAAQSGPRPCESHWYAMGDGVDGSMVVTGTLLGLPLAQFATNLTDRSAQITTEQLNEVRGSASLPSASSQSGTETIVGGTGGAASATADDSLSTAVDLYHNPAPVGPGTSRSVTVSESRGADVAVLTTTMAEGGTAGSVAAASAAAQSADLGGGAGLLLDSDRLSSGHARGVLGGAVTIALSAILPAAPQNQGRLLHLPGEGVTGTAEADRDPGADPATADDDLIVASATRTLGTGSAELFALPSGASPGAGWAGHLVRVTNWSSSASAAAGPGATAAGTAVTQSGTLSYWNGAGYTDVDLASGSLDDLALGAAASFAGCDYSLSARLSGGGASTVVEHTDGDPTKPIRTARAVVNAPASGTASYSVTCSGTDVAQLTVDFSLGRTLAETHFSVPGA